MEATKHLDADSCMRLPGTWLAIVFIEGSEIRIAPSLQCLPHSLELLDTSVRLVDKWLC